MEKSQDGDWPYLACYTGICEKPARAFVMPSAAEAALYPPIRCSESLHLSSFQRISFCRHGVAYTAALLNDCMAVLLLRC